MDNMRFNSPRSVLFGVGVSENVGATIKNELNYTKVAVITGDNLYKKGLVHNVIKSIEDVGIKTYIWHDVTANPSCSTVEKCYNFVRELDVQALVAIGGGSIIDTAKGTSILMNNEAPISQYLDNPAGIPNPGGLPIISVSTTAGTGSEVTAGFILINDESHLKAGAAHPSVTPVIAFIDPKLHATMPIDQTVATSFDTLAHALESYVSKKRNPMSKMYAHFAIQQVFNNLEKAVAEPTNADVRYELALGAYQGGLAMCYGSCGINHALAYPLESGWHIPHGAANAALLPATVKFNLCAAKEEYREIAGILGADTSSMSDDEAINYTSDAIKSLANKVGVKRLRELGVKDEDIPALSNEAMKMERLLSLTPRRPNREEISEIYLESM